jgi:hypothetical protein
VERDAVAELVAGDVSQERRRREAARDNLLGRRGGEDRVAALLLDAVLGAGDDQPHLGRAPPGELAALLEADARVATLELWVEDLEALLGQVGIAEVATAGRLRPLPATGWGGSAAGGGLRFGGGLAREALRELIELGELLAELELELGGVDPLGLGDEDAALQEIELELDPLIRLT